MIPVQLAPLRDRKEDIPLLVQHFLEKFVAERNADPERTTKSDSARGVRPSGERAAERLTVSQEAMRRLMAYQWPGNVRQLENAIERAVAFTAGRSQIDVTDLPIEIQQAQEPTLSASIARPEESVEIDAAFGNEGG